MGILMGALGGIGNALHEQAQAETKSSMARENELAVGQQRSDLELQRQQTMAEFTNNMKNAPLNRLSAKAKELSGQEVPVQAEPVTSLSGSDPGLDPETGATAGTQENYADLVALAKSLPVEDQQPYLDQLKRQFGADTETAQAGILGKTRKRTADESLQAAADYAKVNDLSAYADYEARIGKPLRDEKRVGILDKREEHQDVTNNRRLDIQENFNASHEAWQRSMAVVAESRASRAESNQNTRADKTERQSNRVAISSVLKDIATQEDKIQIKLLDPMLDDKQKAVLQGQFKTLDNDRVQARSELMKLAGVEPTKKEDAPQRNGWDSATGQVFKDGKVIGTAKSEKEGRSLYQNLDPKKTQSATPPATNSAGGSSAALLEDLKGELKTRVPGTAAYEETQANISALEGSQTKVTDSSANTKPAAVVSTPTVSTPAVSDNSAIIAKLNIENREINDFKRTKFSPEVQAYLDKKKAAASAAEQATSDAYRAAELKRNLSRNR